MSAKTGGDGDPSHEEDSGCVIEVGSQAVWSLSSCKPGKFRILQMHCVWRRHIEFCVSNVCVFCNRLWRGTAARQLYGHILAIRWPSTAFSKYPIPAKDGRQSDLYLHRLQIGWELHAESHIDTIGDAFQWFAGNRNCRSVRTDRQVSTVQHTVHVSILMCSRWLSFWHRLGPNTSEGYSW